MATTKIEASNIATGAVPSTGFTSVQVFTAASTWTRPTDITKVIVEVQGGGAGGGRSNTATIIQGGSGGGYAKKFIDVSSVTKSVISVGSAGVGATTDAAGTDGGDSQWLDTAHGGSSDVKGLKGVGEHASGVYAIGGLGSGGDINIQGQNGNKSYTGFGGGSQLGRGGPGKDGSGGTAGDVDATGYGGGGGGVELGTITRAGNGTPGIVIVWEFK